MSSSYALSQERVRVLSRWTLVVTMQDITTPDYGLPEDVFLHSNHLPQNSPIQRIHRHPPRGRSVSSHQRNQRAARIHRPQHLFCPPSQLEVTLAAKGEIVERPAYYQYLTTPNHLSNNSPIQRPPRPPSRTRADLATKGETVKRFAHNVLGFPSPSSRNRSGSSCQRRDRRAAAYYALLPNSKRI